MCGICGIVAPLDSEQLAQRIASSTQSIAHRGPDHCGCFVDQGIALGHTRLSIVDLSADANQPMVCPRSGRQIVFNGEIYNFADLRSQLEKLRYRFRTRSDTEVLLHGYDAWKVDLFTRLNGIFAFAIWDVQTRSLVLCRDRFGVKPLYYVHTDGEFVFGSEIKSILAACPTFPATVSLPSLHEFAYYGVPLGGKTFFENIHELPPGSWATITGQRLEMQRYWRIDEVQAIDPPAEEAVQHTRGLLEQAVATQLTGDVPIGVFLSGGLDSSCLTAFASRHYPGRLATYSVGFDFSSDNELPLARKVADHFNTDHHEVLIKGAAVVETVQALVECHDAPFSDAANIPLYLLAQQLSGQIKVVLQGDGGDEVFGGYRRYATLARERMMRLLAQSLCKTRLSVGLPARYQRYLECFIPQNRAGRFARMLTMERMCPSPTRIFSQDVVEALRGHDPFARYSEVVDPLESLDAVQAMLMTDMQIILPDVFLEKVDKSTMAHGLEVRVPLLENRLTEYLISLPSKTKVRRGEKKWLLKQALKGVIPDEIIHSPKRGFNVPFSNWLRGPLADFALDALHSDYVKITNLFDYSCLELLWREHASGKSDHGFLLWKAMNLALWIDKYRVSLR